MCLRNSSLNFEPRVQPIENGFTQFPLNRLNLDFVNDFLGKAIGQKISGQVGMDSAALEIKKFVRVKLANRRARS